MAVRHHALTTPDGRATALISDSEATTTAIVFVHGFRGHCSKSWQYFQVLIDDPDICPEIYADADLYFFDYDAENNHLGTSVQELRTFLENIYPLPPSSLFQYSISELDWADKEMLETESEVIRSSPFIYRELKLVGHSLGGVVIRSLIAEQSRQWEISLIKNSQTRPPYSLSARLSLFAPAHLGVAPSGPLAPGINILEKIQLGLLSQYRAYLYLKENGRSLVDLRSKTEAMAQRHPALAGFRASVMWGEKEWLVQPGIYDCDWSERYVPEKGHIGICKPDLTYTLPLRFLKSERGEAWKTV